jgi:FAD/FMN-containing dehydrogenase
LISRAEYESKREALRAQLGNAKNVRLGKSTSNLFRHRTTSDHLIDVRQFNNVIEINPKTLTADVEGMTTYETFVSETLKLGLRPTVIPEFKTITVGGAATGIGLESSSFKYGFVHETIQEIEVLLASGQILTCSSAENADLFYGFPNSYGTLGYGLRLRVQLVPILPYVKIAHERFNDFKTYFKSMKEACARPVDFIDGTIFNDKEMYLTTGIHVNSAPYLSDYTYMNIYYKSIRAKTEDFMTMENFLWRWDTDWYWGSRKFGAQNRVVRYFMGPKRLRSSYYWRLRSKLNRTPFWKLLKPFVNFETVIQDVDIPIENAAEFMKFQSKKIGITPVWACPVNTFNKKLMYPLYPLSPSTTYVNLGFWDIVRTTQEAGYFNRLVERKVTEAQGRKILYSDACYPSDEFDTLYGGAAYAALKNKYDPNRTFKTVFEKCVSKK